MYFIAPDHLNFEEKDGMLSAALSLDSMSEMIEMVGCFPCRANGKWGLIYFKMKGCEEANDRLIAACEEAPLLRQLFRAVVHRPEIDIDSMRLFVPGRAARFAQIKHKAVLTQISEGCMLLTAEEE